MSLVTDRIRSELGETQQLVSALLLDAAVQGQIAACAELCVASLKAGGKILLAGNGGALRMRSTLQASSSVVLLSIGPVCPRLL